MAALRVKYGTEISTVKPEVISYAVSIRKVEASTMRPITEDETRPKASKSTSPLAGISHRTSKTARRASLAVEAFMNLPRACRRCGWVC